MTITIKVTVHCRDSGELPLVSSYLQVAKQAPYLCWSVLPPRVVNTLVSLSSAPPTITIILSH